MRSPLGDKTLIFSRGAQFKERRRKMKWEELARYVRNRRRKEEELRPICRVLGLSTEGNRDELRERLEEHIAQQPQDEEAPWPPSLRRRLRVGWGQARPWMWRVGQSIFVIAILAIIAFSVWGVSRQVSTPTPVKMAVATPTPAPDLQAMLEAWTEKAAKAAEVAVAKVEPALKKVEDEVAQLSKKVITSEELAVVRAKLEADITKAREQLSQAMEGLSDKVAQKVAEKTEARIAEVEAQLAKLEATPIVVQLETNSPAVNTTQAVTIPIPISATKLVEGKVVIPEWGYGPWGIKGVVYPKIWPKTVNGKAYTGEGNPKGTVPEGPSQLVTHFDGRNWEPQGTWTYELPAGVTEIYVTTQGDAPLKVKWEGKVLTMWSDAKVTAEAPDSLDDAPRPKEGSIGVSLVAYIGKVTLAPTPQPTPTAQPTVQPTPQPTATPVPKPAHATQLEKGKATIPKWGTGTYGAGGVKYSEVGPGGNVPIGPSQLKSDFTGNNWKSEGSWQYQLPAGTSEVWVTTQGDAPTEVEWAGNVLIMHTSAEISQRAPKSIEGKPAPSTGSSGVSLIIYLKATS